MVNANYFLKYCTFNKELLSIRKFWLLLLLLLGGCTKQPNPVGGVVKFANGNIGLNKAKIAVQSASQTVTIFQLQRDSSNFSGIQQEVIIDVTLNPALLAAYNTQHNTHYQFLPASIYLPEDGILQNGNVWKIKLTPGQASKNIQIKIPNAKSINFLNQYALAFSISAVNGNAKISVTEKDIVAGFTGVNRYSGRYRITGTLMDALSPVTKSIEPYWDAELLGIGADSAVLFDPYITNSFSHPAQAGIIKTGYDKFMPLLVFNTQTHNVIKIVNYWGNPSVNNRSALLDTGASWMDSTSRTITLKYLMQEAGTVSAGAPRVRFNEVLKYLGQ